MRRGLTVRMFAGLLAGIVLGVAANLLAGDSPRLAGFVQYVTEPVGRVFLRLLFMLVIPLIVSALALGVAGLGDLRRLGRIGLKTLAYTVGVSAHRGADRRRAREPAAPRARAVPRAAARLDAQSRERAARRRPRGGASGVDFLVELVPTNVVKAMADGDMLGGDGLRAVSRHRPVADADRRRARASRRRSKGSTTSPCGCSGSCIELAPRRRRVPAVHAHRAARLDVLAQLGAYVRGRAARAGDPPVRRLLGWRCAARRHEPAGASSAACARRDADRLLDRLEQRDAADRAAGGRGGAAAAAARQPLRAHASARPPTRTAPRCSRASRCCSWRSSTACELSLAQQVHGGVHLHPRRHRHGRRARRLDPGDRDDPRPGRACRPRASA